MISEYAHLKNRNDSIPICRGVYIFYHIRLEFLARSYF